MTPLETRGIAAGHGSKDASNRENLIAGRRAASTDPEFIARMDTRRADLDAFLTTGRFPAGTVRTVRWARAATPANPATT
jgi:hypothetical protein